MISNLLYYTIFASALLLYGVGIERSTVLASKHRHIYLRMIKMLICVSSTSTLVYLFSTNVLIPAGLGELYPFVAALIFTVISVFIEIIIRITAKISAAEFGSAYLFILIGVNESLSLPECLLNSCMCIVSLFIAIPFIYSIKHRIELNEQRPEYEKMSTLLITIAIITLILTTWNISWLNKGVFEW